MYYTLTHYLNYMHRFFFISILNKIDQYNLSSQLKS